MTREEFEALQPGDRVYCLWGDEVRNYGSVIAADGHVLIKWDYFKYPETIETSDSDHFRDLRKIQQPQPRPDDAVMGGK